MRSPDTPQANSLRKRRLSIRTEGLMLTFQQHFYSTSSVKKMFLAGRGIKENPGMCFNIPAGV